MTAVKAVSFRRPRVAEALAEAPGGISIWNGKILPTNELGARHSASFVLNDNFNYYQCYSKLQPFSYMKEAKQLVKNIKAIGIIIGKP